MLSNIKFGNNVLIQETSALEQNGLCSWYGILMEIPSPKVLGKLRTATISLKDFKFTYKHTKYRNGMIIPEVEDSIMPGLIERYNLQPGLLEEALYSYCEEHTDLSKLYEVAKEYNIPKETVDYWIEESSDWTGA